MALRDAFAKCPFFRLEDVTMIGFDTVLYRYYALLENLTLIQDGAYLIFESDRVPLGTLQELKLAGLVDIQIKWAPVVLSAIDGEMDRILHLEAHAPVSSTIQAYCQNFREKYPYGVTVLPVKYSPDIYLVHAAPLNSHSFEIVPVSQNAAVESLIGHQGVFLSFARLFAGWADLLNLEADANHFFLTLSSPAGWTFSLNSDQHQIIARRSEVGPMALTKLVIPFNLGQLTITETSIPRMPYGTSGEPSSVPVPDRYTPPHLRPRSGISDPEAELMVRLNRETRNQLHISSITRTPRHLDLLIMHGPNDRIQITRTDGDTSYLKLIRAPLSATPVPAVGSVSYLSVPLTTQHLYLE